MIKLHLATLTIQANLFHVVDLFGRFVQFADKQGSNYPLYKLTKKEIR
ncbi:hypothetical protein MMM136_14420 [Helicobacter pylori]